MCWCSETSTFFILSFNICTPIILRYHPGIVILKNRRSSHYSLKVQHNKIAIICLTFAVDDGKAVDRPSYTNLRHAFKSIYKQEGFRGFYKGVTPNVVGGGTSWGLYFLL